jgi:hypothetical protein
MLNEEIEIFDRSNSYSSIIAGDHDNVRGLLSDIQNNSLLNTISSAQQFQLIGQKLVFSPEQNVVSILTNFFEGDLGNSEESIIVKLIAFAVMVADEEIPIEGIHDLDPTGIAVVVDSGVTLTKVAYHLSKGKISIQKALEYTYERAIADAGLLISAIWKAKTFAIATTTGAAIGMSLGPPGAVIGGLVGAALSKMSGKIVRTGIKEGTKQIHKASKDKVTQVIDRALKTAVYLGQKAKEAGRNVINSIKQWF